MPDVTVAVVLFDALHNMLHGIDLIGPHDHELLLALDEHHVAADRLAEGALHEEALCEVVEVGDFVVEFVRKFIDGQETLVGVEGEMSGVVVGEVVGAVAIADDEELHEAQECLRVAIARIVLVFDDLLHGAAWADAKGLQLYLHAGHAIDEDEHIVAVVAVVCVDAELVDDLEVVFAPVLEIDQGVVQRRTVVAGEGINAAQGLGGGEDIVRDNFIE